jgi:2,3-bisphosphoglycerate-independent phosphoglycerate mutase
MTAIAKPVLLCILDGWGYRADETDNATLLAKTPHYQKLWQSCPRSFLRTDGLAVGLPPGQMGNSEVGHMNLGAGRVVMQDLPRIDKAITDGSLAQNPVLQDLIKTLRANKKTCHLLGLCSPGGVHSQQAHIVALCQILARAGIKVQLHLWLDGRDTPPQSASEYVSQLAASVAGLPGVRIGTLCGRYYAMDRDNRWERVALAYDAMVLGQGEKFTTAPAALAAAAAAGVTDEFVKPVILPDFVPMQDGDAVLCANFRSDRVRQIFAALLDTEFAHFPRRKIQFSMAVAMTEYSAQLKQQMRVLFPAQSMQDLLGETLAKAGLKQLRAAETEKYPHVTFFFNGGEERQYPGEDRVLVPSPKVATYDLQPEMSAVELTTQVLAAMDKTAYDFILINYANPDMVGHTGDLAAAIAACEAVDACLGLLVAKIQALGGVMLITADHGNAELMRDPTTHAPHTAHTTNPVALLLANAGADAALRDGVLGDVAPTVLSLLGLPQPTAMTGTPLLQPRGKTHAA